MNSRPSRRAWPDQDKALLRRLYPCTVTKAIAEQLGRSLTTVYQQAQHLGLKKTPEFLEGEQAGRIQRGRTNPAMAATQFKAGFTPWNKGAKGLDIGGKQTRFAPGSKPHNTQPVGSYRLNKGGHLQRKISDSGGNNSQRWRGVAELVWCAANGTLPVGHIVVFRPGRFSAVLEQITIDAVECISKAENARRNHPRNKHHELGRLVQIKGAITRQVNRITREAQEQHP